MSDGWIEDRWAGEWWIDEWVTIDERATTKFSAVYLD